MKDLQAKKFTHLILFTFLLCSNLIFCQKITIDDAVGLQPLIENNLTKSCVDISNISSFVNGNSSGFPSYGFFEKANSNFPFQNGIVLSTGRASSGGNFEISPVLSEGSTIWGTDPDLETALGVTGTVNATSVEFDFVSISTRFQFNYILASEEYSGIFPCQFADGFAFLIKEAGTNNPFVNIALVPGTNIPVNTSTIHNLRANTIANCEPQNEEFFAGYTLGDTNYQGRTVVLSASGNILPNVTYRIKLVIADQNNGEYDSAVFIEGDSFKILDLGEDISTCGTSATLNADLQNPLASYTWYRNNTLITGAINETYTAIQDGTYRAEVSVPINGTPCIETDEIVVVLNTEEPMDPISDFSLCDDVTEDDIEIFDLSIKDPEVIANAPFANFAFSYHITDNDARFNKGAITTPIANTVNPQPIFVRVQDSDSNCISISSFNLIVSPLPTIVNPTPLQVCDGDNNPDGFAIIDLSQKDDEITNNNTNLLVSYHYNPTDASSPGGDNPIPTPYINTNTPNERVYARIVDITTGCITNTVLDVEIIISPEANRDRQFIDACDTDLDGAATFDLTEVLSAILDGLTNVTTTFHTSQENANMNIMPITDPTNFDFVNTANEPSFATLYLRIVDNVTGCASIVPFEAHTNLLLTGTNTGDFALCDNNDITNDSLDFDLNTIEAFIGNDLPSPNPIVVSFYEDEDDRNNEINALDKSQPYNAVSPQVLFISIENGSCSEQTEITLFVNPILLFGNVTIPYCDADNDGIATIDFESTEPGSINDIVTGSNTNFMVTYFDNQMDADNNNENNQLPPFYNNTDPVETIYARIANIDSGCSTVNPFNIEVLVAPATNQPINEIICDNDQDGLSSINLENKIDETLPNRSGFNIDVFTTFEDANNNIIANAIPVAERANYTTNTQTIFIRIEDSTSGTGCYAVVSFEIIINTIPIIPADIIFRACEANGANFGDFILMDADAEILNGQPGKEVYYFENQTDAVNGNLANAIPKDVAYNSESKTIYIRVENSTDSTCFSTGLIKIEVAPNPVYDPIIDFLVCDDASNDGINEFNLQEKADEILASAPNPLNISFHLTPEHAENSTNPLPTTFSNNRNPQSIYIRIESSAAFCFIVEELGLNVIPAPDVLVGSPSLTSCAPTSNGEAPFDLTFFNIDTVSPDFEITDRVKSSLEISYFDGTTEIINPTNYTSISKTVNVQITNNLTTCKTLVPVELFVNMPPKANTIGTVTICDNETDTFNLSQITTMLVDDPSLVSISYHINQNDADNNLAPLNDIFNYTANSHEIFIRVSDMQTQCPILTSFILAINENPTANTPPNLVSCDDDYDGQLSFNLTTNNSSILGAANPLNYTVAYYNNFESAENKTAPLPETHLATNNETIFARLENNNTGCFSITQFNILINPLPIIPINDIVPLCDGLPVVVSANTGFREDTYSWSTGSTDSEITIPETNPGRYSVTVTRPNTVGANCTYTHNFVVTSSDAAIINFTPTVNFADPNRIIVEIDNSRIGDYIFLLDGNENTPANSNIFNDVTFGPHIVTVRDLNGCMDATEPVFIFDIPKFVTPNNDNAYDTWHIIGANQLPGTMVYIYSRYGKLIKTLAHDSEGWDGTYNGKNMPADDYWFSADIVQNGETFNIRGHFALKR